MPMKTIFTILCATLFISCIQDPNDIQQPDVGTEDITYTWYKNEKVNLYPTDNCYKVYRAADMQQREKAEQEYKNLGCLQKDPLLFSVITTPDIAETLSLSYEEVYSIPVYKTESGYEVKFSERITVITDSEDDYDKLVGLAKLFNVEIVEKSEYLENWYNLACTNQSRGTSLEIANIMQETNFFAQAFPGPILEFSLCSTDPMYNQQWGLKNTGQVVQAQTQQYNATPNIDIGYDSVKHLIPNESDIKVAVIDIGVANHPELTIDSFWDAFTKTPIKTIHGDNIRGDHHGTYCAGIIGAKKNNNIGITGIAPVKIMGISIKFSTTTTNIYEDINLAFQHAVNNGADVISCSWEGPSAPLATGIEYQIERAFTEGRNGKGCIIVFASGNGNISQVTYPANTDSRILCVGAITPNGERATPQNSNFGSNFGQHLDIVAPGVGIISTNASSQYGSFTGTSAACPFVSGVAAALLAIDPTLTQPEVNNIIEQTTLKVGSGYSQYANRPNGSWSAEYGYGLVRLDNAISYTFPSQTINDTTINQDTTYRGSNVTFNNVTVNSAQVDILSVFNHVGLNSVTLSADSDTNISSHTTININGMTMTGDSHLLSNSTLTTSINGITMRNSSNAEFCATSFTINPGVDIASGSQLQLTIN